MLQRCVFIKQSSLTAIFWISGLLWGMVAASSLSVPLQFVTFSVQSAFGLILSSWIPLFFAVIFILFHWDLLLYGTVFIFAFAHSFSLFYLSFYVETINVFQLAGLMLSQTCCGFLILLVGLQDQQCRAHFYLSVIVSSSLIGLLVHCLIPW